jgi:hypothetical protein
MSQLRLLIKRPGKDNTRLPVTVDETDLIGNCISSLVDHLGLPRRDRLGRVLTYSLRPLSGGQPLSSTLRFADERLLPEARLVLALDDANTVTQPVSTSMSGSYPARVSGAEPPVAPSRQIVNRRTFVVGSILTGCAVSGFLTGMATAFATRRRAYASYNVAKKVIEFEYQEEIPRSRLRAAYGDGFKGAPLRCGSSGEGQIPQDALKSYGKAPQALSAIWQENNAIGGPCHV